MTAWRRKNENMLNDIRSIVSSIRHRHKIIGRMLESIAGRVPALEDFQAQRELFEVTVENGQLFRRIEETFKKEQPLIAQSANYYSSNPIQESTGVKEVRDRLSNILEILKTVGQHFGLDDSATRKPTSKRQKQVSHANTHSA